MSVKPSERQRKSRNKVTFGKPVSIGETETTVELSPESKDDNLDSEKFDSPIRKRAQVDPLSAALGCDNLAYYHKMTWHWLKFQVAGRRYRLTVDRFYPTRRIAVDINPKGLELEHVDLKHKLCEEQNIRYFVLKEIGDFDDMIKQLESH